MPVHASQPGPDTNRYADGTCCGGEVFGQTIDYDYRRQTHLWPVADRSGSNLASGPDDTFMALCPWLPSVGHIVDLLLQLPELLQRTFGEHAKVSPVLSQNFVPIGFENALPASHLFNCLVKLLGCFNHDCFSRPVTES
jgi:hypothetical protein